MLEKDVLELKQVLKTYRKDRKFQKQFANIMLMSTKQGQQSIRDKFSNKFPKLSYLSESPPYQYSYCSVINSFTNNLTIKSETQPQYSREIDKQDEQIWRKHGQENKTLIVLQPNKQIQIIIECFKQLQKNTPSNIYDKLFQIYKQKGGYKNYQQFKQKIQGDVLYLVKRQKQKKRK